MMSYLKKLINLLVSVNVLFSFSDLYAIELDYEFRWMYVPVAKLSLNINESLFAANKDDSFNAEFQLSSQGPLKLYRNYSSKGYVRGNSTSSWEYYLTGIDRGQPEKKSINYFHNAAPEIKEFLDDSGVLPIKVDSVLDKNAIDPFSILLKIIRQLSSQRECVNLFYVMDGKRRYKVELLFMGKNSVNKHLNKDDLFHCRLQIQSNENQIDDSVQRHWPFNGSKKIVDIWFSEAGNFQPIRFKLKGPFGNISGKLVRD